MQLFKVGFLHYGSPLVEQGEIHLQFAVEEKCREWIAINNGLALDYRGLPIYRFLGALNAS